MSSHEVDSIIKKHDYEKTLSTRLTDAVVKIDS